MAPRYPTSPSFRRHRPQGQLSPGAAGVIGILAIGGVLYSLSSDGRGVESIMEEAVPAFMRRIGVEKIGGREIKFPFENVGSAEGQGSVLLKSALSGVVPTPPAMAKDAKDHVTKRGVVALPVLGGGHGAPLPAAVQANAAKEPLAARPGKEPVQAAHGKGVTPEVVHEKEKGSLQEEEAGVHPEEKLVLTFYSDLKKQTVVLPPQESSSSARFPHGHALSLGSFQTTPGTPPAQAVSYVQVSRSTPWQQPLDSLAKAGTQQMAAARVPQGVASKLPTSHDSSMVRETQKSSSLTVNEPQRLAGVRPGQSVAGQPITSQPAVSSVTRSPSATPIPVVSAASSGQILAQDGQLMAGGSKASGPASYRARAARMEDGSFMVPLGDYPDFTRAARMTNRLQAKGVPAQVVRLSGGAEPVFRVGIGPFPSEGDAMRAAQQWQPSL
ncbi:MAG: SPOR domain-containing protein [Magnetococcales bacterium]|nr:SPOR domain-containing protein [Magnetococcales bacterium]